MIHGGLTSFLVNLHLESAAESHILLSCGLNSRADLSVSKDDEHVRLNFGEM